MEDKWEKADKVAKATKEPDANDIKLAAIELTDLSDSDSTTDEPDAPTAKPISHGSNHGEDKDAKVDKPTESTGLPPSIQRVLHPEPASDDSTSSKGFLFAYITSVFSSFALLFGTAFLGYALFEHFINPPAKNNPDQYFYFDLAPFYLSLMASLMVFGVLYVFTSRYAAHCVANDHVSARDWRVYRVVYALFAAYIVATGASVLASILYIPLAQALITEDMTAQKISVLILGGFHVIVWIALLVWQERLVKHGKQSIVHGTIVAVAALILIILVGIFPVGGKTDDRFDHRITTDFETIEAKINAFASDSKGELPTSLDQLKFDNSPIENRLSKYRYTVKTATESDATYSSRESEDEDYNLSGDTFSSRSRDDTYENGSGKKTYELCATFRTDTLAKTRPDSIFDTLSRTTAQTQTSAKDEFDRHKTGEVCFERAIHNY